MFNDVTVADFLYFYLPVKLYCQWTTKNVCMSSGIYSNNEIKGDLSYNEKKDFAQYCVDEKIIARLLGKSHRRKRRFSAFVILYAAYLMVILVLLLTKAENLATIIMVSVAIILLPLLTVNTLANKGFLGYQKLELVLRIITKFYVRKK